MNGIVLLDAANLAAIVAWSVWLMRRDRFCGFFALVASYYTFLIFVFHLGGAYIHREGYTGKAYEIDDAVFLSATAYAAAFNALFMAVLTFRVKPFALARLTTGIDARLLTNVYFAVFFLGAMLYYSESGSFNYADYVSFRGIAYGWVFLIVGTSFLVLAYLLRLHGYIVVGLLVYAYFGLKTGVRSFLLMPLLPLAILSLAKSDRNLGRKTILYGGALLAVALALLLLRPAENAALPEMLLIHGLHVIFYTYADGGQHTSSPLLGFMVGFVNFFAKVDLDQYDPAIRFAQDYFGFTTPDGFYHMPFTWYADSFAAAGYGGVVYAAVWGLAIRGLKWLVSRDPLALAAFLPQACWICFFVIRGAAANATNSITTAIWLSIALYLFLKVAALRARQPLH
ncbi:hypothetical protein ACL598_19260 [Bordetella bronchialis]|uniref:hypothetical protein n=1 Tax=Bordetella bronchialis TaxID=463025 RepID=UPI003D033CCF